MRDTDQEHQRPTIGLTDISFIFFKHKHLILWSSGLGLLAAVVIYFFMPPPYQSQSKLLVRYVLDRSVVDPQETQIKAPDATYNDNLITAEKEILSSWDLASQVVASLSSEKLLKNVGADRDKVVVNFLKGLTVTGSKGSNIITATYMDPNPQVAQCALQELISRYFVRHLEVHRSASAFEYVADETSKVQSRLNQIEEDLKRVKDQAGILSLKESTESLSSQIAKSQESLDAAEEAVVSQKARVKELEKLLGAPDSSSSYTSGLQANRRDVRNYQLITLGITTLRQKELDLLSRYTPESPIVRTNKDQISALEAQQRDLEHKFPGLIASIPESSSKLSLVERNPQLDLIAEKATLAALSEKAGVLRDQFKALKERAATFSDMAPQIAMLQRKRELEETNYKYFQESLDKARIDEALDPSKIPNISVVQKPTPAIRAPGSRNKLLLALSFGGLVLGMTWATLIELVFDRTLKRPVELDLLNIPKLMTIPHLPHQNRLLSPGRGTESDSDCVSTQPCNSLALPWENSLKPYGEALRDRLILYFQLKGINRKPRFLALTGCSRGTATAEMAGALAMAFSKADEGKVLFVNMKQSKEDMHPLFESNVSYPLTEALRRNGLESAGIDNLYLATASSSNQDSDSVLPKRLHDLIPLLKSSDFGYIIFDMPPLGPTSSTLAMVGFMDKVLLVVESEVSVKSHVKRAYEDLLDARADVSAIFNKCRSYGPKWFQMDV